MSLPVKPKLYRPKDADKLTRLHPDLAAVTLRCAALGYKFIIIETQRGRAVQTKAYNTGHSKAKFGQSPHNFSPSLAIDIGPANYPGKLADYRELALGMFLAAKELGISIDWGGDWKSFKDYPHFQLSNWKRIKKTLAE